MHGWTSRTRGHSRGDAPLFAASCVGKLLLHDPVDREDRMHALRQTLARLVAVSLLPAALSAQVFNGGLPAGYVCQGVPEAAGVCGVSPASGVVTLAPGGGTSFGYVTTDGSEYRG